MQLESNVGKHEFSRERSSLCNSSYNFKKYCRVALLSLVSFDTDVHRQLRCYKPIYELIIEYLTCTEFCALV
jgi:hypothetical protein